MLAIVASASTPQVAFTHLTKSPNLQSALTTLSNLGAVSYTDTTVELTQSGQQIAASEDIIDASGNLTQTGQQLVGPAAPTPPDSMGSPDQMPVAPDPVPPEGNDELGDLGEQPMESFSMLKSMLR